MSFLLIESAPAFCSALPSCVLYTTWTPIFSATVHFCPAVCLWYLSSFLSSLSVLFLCSCVFFGYRPDVVSVVIATCHWCRSRAALGSSRKSLHTPVSTTPGEGRPQRSPFDFWPEQYKRDSHVFIWQCCWNRLNNAPCGLRNKWQ